MSELIYERVAAGDIGPGDWVARARTHTFRRVAAIQVGAKSVRLTYDDYAGTDRPNKEAQWWRLLTTE